MTFQQDQRLIERLLDMQRCRHLEQFATAGSDTAGNGQVCRSAIYRPCDGYVPRAFGGAKRALEDVKLVIVSNGPAKPILPTDRIPGESYSGDPEEDLRSLLGDRYINSEPHSIHTNLKLFLNLVFPCGGGLEEQLAKVWMTNSVHCTFEGEVKMADRKRCANANLFRQIELFSNPVVVLAGSKPQLISSDLLSAFPYIRLVKCHSFSKPFPKGKAFAENDWREAADRVKVLIAEH
jgi:hypothetical protein